MNSLISVIVPIYKVEEDLDRCIKSIVNQTYKNLEIILVDDGSPDACPNMCDEWAKKDDRIVVVHKKNEGIGIARNTGIELSKGEYLCFVDSDDYITEDSIQIMYNRIKQDNSELVVARPIIVYKDGSKKNPPDNIQAITIEKPESVTMFNDGKSLLSRYVWVWGKLYKKSVFDDIRFLPLKHSEDLQIWPRVIDRCNLISIIPDAVYYYVQRDISIVHTMNYQKYLDSIVAMLFVADFFEEHGYTDVSRRYYRNAIFIAYRLKDMREARALITKSLWKKGRNISCNMDIKILIGWLGMYPPMNLIMNLLLRYRRCDECVGVF